MSLLSTVSTNLCFFSNAEKKIANIIIENPKQFTSLTAEQLSKIADVSQGTINNFSKKLNCSGFSDMKLKIAEELNDFKKEFKKSKTENSDILKSSLEEITVSLKHLISNNTVQTLTDVADRIIKAKRVDVYGIYKSGIVAKDFCYQLIQLGIPASFYEDMLLSAVSAACTDKDSVVFAISETGITRDIISAVEYAKKNNAYIIALTRNKFSKLAEIADCVLVSPIISDDDYLLNHIRTSQLFIVDTISKIISSKQNNEIKNKYIKEALDSHSLTENS